MTLALLQGSQPVTYVERLLAHLEGQDPAWAFWVLGVFCLIEYLFPPFPGDMVTALGAFVIKAKGWSMLHAFLASLAGSLLGGVLQFALGRWLWRHAHARPGTWLARSFAQLEPWRAKVDRHGAALILVSRFLPVLRGPLLVAAGTTHVHLPRATLAFVAGVCAWNAVLFGLGTLAGRDPATVGRWLERYALVIWGLLALALIWWWIRRQRRARAGQSD